MQKFLSYTKYLIFTLTLVVLGFSFGHSAEANQYSYSCPNGGTIISDVNISQSTFSANNPTPFTVSASITSMSCAATSINLTAQNNNGTVYTVIPSTTLASGGFLGPYIDAATSHYVSPSAAGTYAVHFITGVMQPVFVKATALNVSQWTTTNTVCNQSVTLDHVTSSGELIEFFADPLGTIPLDVTGLGFKLSDGGVLTPVLSGTSYILTPGISYHEDVTGGSLGPLGVGQAGALLGGIGGLWGPCISFGLTGFGNVALGFHSLRIFNLAFVATPSPHFTWSSDPAPVPYEKVVTPPTAAIYYNIENAPYTYPPAPPNPPAPVGESIAVWFYSDAATCTSPDFSTGGLATGVAYVPVTLANTGQALTINCSNIAGSATASVVINSAPPTIDIYPDQGEVDPGTNVVLTWSSAGATACTGNGFSTGGAVSGTATVMPSGGYVGYQISCYGPGGTSTATAYVQVREPVQCQDEYGWPYYCPYNMQCTGAPYWGCQ